MFISSAIINSGTMHTPVSYTHLANCNLCGLCTLVCPTQVFQIDQPQLLQYEKNQPLQLCCSQNMTAPEQALRINCLQQLTPLAILHLLYQHGKLTLYVSSEDCQQCAHRWYPQGLIQQLEQYACLLYTSAQSALCNTGM